MFLIIPSKRLFEHLRGKYEYFLTTGFNQNESKLSDIIMITKCENYFNIFFSSSPQRWRGRCPCDRAETS